MNRTDLKKIVSSIQPGDRVEEEHLADTLRWLDTAGEVYRIAKPATPAKHLVCYFVMFDPVA